MKQIETGPGLRGLLLNETSKVAPGGRPVLVFVVRAIYRLREPELFITMAPGPWGSCPCLHSLHPAQSPLVCYPSRAMQAPLLDLPQAPCRRAVTGGVGLAGRG